MNCCSLSESAADVSKGRSTDLCVIAGLTGACKMLAAIAKYPRYTQKVEQAGGLEAILSGLMIVQTNPDAVAACLATLAPMSQTTSLADQIMRRGIMTLVSH